MRYAANAITLLRIPLSIALLYLPPYGALFVLLYLLCGLSDALDGYIARRTHTQSRLGAVLDSVADAVFFCVLLVLILRERPGAVFLWAAASITLLRLCSLLTGMLRFRRIAMMHTYLNKAAGLLLYLYPLSLAVVSSQFLLIAAGLTAFLASMEEFVLLLNSATFDPDTKSIFHK